MAWSDFFLPDSAQTVDEAEANLARQRAQYQAALERREAAGTITPERDTAAKQYIATVALEDQNAAALEGFKEGLVEGRDNINKTFFGAVGGILKLIPLPVWIAGAVVLFLYLGGFAFLAKTLKGRLAK